MTAPRAPAEVIEFHLRMALDTLDRAETDQEKRIALIGIARACDAVERQGFSLPPEIAAALKEANLDRFRARAGFEGPRVARPGDRGADGALRRLASLVAALFE
jgi:hypothetical protein